MRMMLSAAVHVALFAAALLTGCSRRKPKITAAPEGMETEYSQNGWRLKSGSVDAFVTANGGHMAPVSFCTDSGTPIRPYYISPWQDEGLTGGMPLGYHSMLAVPEEKGALRVATSDFEVGMTSPTLFSNPEHGAYQSLAVNERFTDLTKAPVMAKGAPPADCTSYPERIGHQDLLQIFKRPSADPAWTTATCQKKGYLWFTLKDASVLPATIFWIAIKGQHGAPWSRRNSCLGLEENCAFFASGLVPSVTPNMVNEAGFATSVEFKADAPTKVRFIQGAVRVPDDFVMVESVKFAPGKVTFVSVTGKTVEAKVTHGFLKTGEL